MRKPLIRLGIVDDHPTFRVGLRRLLEQEDGLRVAWDCGTLADMTSALVSDPVEAVLLDLNLGPNQDSLAATRALVAKKLAIVIVISSSLDDEAVLAAQHAGAVGYLPKDLAVADLVGAIKRLAMNRSGVVEFVDLVGGKRSAADSRHGLTRREREVLTELRRGRTNREIAARLGVSVTTINKHVQQVLRKLNVHNRAQAVARLQRESESGFSKPSGTPAVKAATRPAKFSSRGGSNRQ